jgi:hypothetical protein
MENRKIPYPKGLRLEMLKLSEMGSPAFVRNLCPMSVKSIDKFSSIANAINLKFLHTFYSFLSLSKF